MLQIFSLALLGAATTISHQIFPSTCHEKHRPSAATIMLNYKRLAWWQKVGGEGLDLRQS